MTKMLNYTLRSSSESDFYFVLLLHHQTMREYVEPIYGWDEDKQFNFVKAWFNPSQIKIIQINNEDVGLIEVKEREFEFYLENIFILPTEQRKGLGTKILLDILSFGTGLKKPLALQVLKTNPDALKLYERLNFELIAETETHFQLRRT